MAGVDYSSNIPKSIDSSQLSTNNEQINSNKGN